MLRCWAQNPEDRPTFMECKELIKTELKSFCQECYNQVERVFNNLVEQPNYPEIRNKIASMQVEEKQMPKTKMANKFVEKITLKNWNKKQTQIYTESQSVV